MSSNLSADGTLVEGELVTLQDVPIAATTLARTAGDDGVQTRGLELALNGGLDLSSSLVAVGLLLLDALALLHLLGLLLGLTSATDTLAVVGLVPLAEGGGIDLDDGGLREGVCADQLVVGRVEDDSDDAGLAGNALTAPGEVSRVETQGAELAVASAGADEVDSLGADSGVGGLASLLEGALYKSLVSRIYRFWTWRVILFLYGIGNAPVALLLCRLSRLIYVQESVWVTRGVLGVFWGGLRAGRGKQSAELGQKRKKQRNAVGEEVAE